MQMYGEYCLFRNEGNVSPASKRVVNKRNVFSVSNHPSALPIRLDEADIRETYPWEYKNLTQRLRLRYENFKENIRYHQIRKELEGDSRFCRERLLDPLKPDGTKKKFYNPNILREFDPHYVRSKKPVNPETA